MVSAHWQQLDNCATVWQLQLFAQHCWHSNCYLLLLLLLLDQAVAVDRNTHMQ